MRFHLIDRIESWEAWQRISARKVTSVHEEYWQPTASGAVLPFGLALEALCQAGTWLIMLSSDHTQRAALLTVGQARLRREVRPGEVLSMEATVTSRNGEAAVIDGTVAVNGRTVLEATDIMCALIDAEELDDPADTARMARQLVGGRLL